MEYRRLGKSGLQVSALSFGSWLTFGAQISDETAESLMVTAYDQGVNFFDNAEGYAQGRSELVMGKILKNTAWDRTSYVVSSKVFFGDGRTKPNQTGLSRKHLMEACHDALRRFQLEYLDLYFCHRPDPNTPVEEIVWTMTTLIQQGKILYWGTSEWPADLIMQAYHVAETHHLIAPTMEQPQYNLFERNRVETEYRHLFRLYGMGTTIWSPLASGLLTGKYSQGIPESTRLEKESLGWLRDLILQPEKLAKVQKVQTVADRLGVPLPQLGIAWCLKNPNVSTVILGASKSHQLTQNLESLAVLPLLTQEVMDELDEIMENKPQRTH